MTSRRPSGREPDADAADRRTVLEAAVLWGPADDGLVANLGHGVNHKRVARLMRLMDVQAVVPGPHTG